MKAPSAEEELRALKLALGLYVLVFGLKLADFLATGVIALLAEALHTLNVIPLLDFSQVPSIGRGRESVRQSGAHQEAGAGRYPDQRNTGEGRSRL